MANLSQGRIVWAKFADRNGYNEKPHPVIILTLTSEIPHQTELVGVVASHTAALQVPRPHCWIELPHHSQKCVSTKFDRPTVAVCDWSVKVTKADIKDDDIGGYLQPTLLELVVKAYLDFHKHNAPISVDLPPSAES